MRSWLAITFSVFMTLPGIAATFYLDPVNGSLNNPGTMAAPWPSLEKVILANMVETQEYAPLPYDPATSKLIPKNVGAPVQAGDTLILLSGLHGAVEIDRHVNSGYITIMAGADHTPILASIRLRSSAFWRIEGVEISSEPYGFYTDDHLVFIESHGWRGPSDHVEIRNCLIRSGEDAWNWSQQEWLDRVTNGIYVKGDHVLIEDNLVTNIYMGISLVGDSLVARNNQVINFAGDGMRALGAHQLIEGNLIKNCFDIDDNHDDGIQSFNLGANDVSDIVIRGNTILNYDDPNQPLLGPLQGIGCFDGPYTDWVIENNVISVDHWHGISLYGAYNCKIINNTVLDPTPGITPGPSWIRVQDNKDGTPSEGCVVKNNIANTFVVDGEQSHNLALPTTAVYSGHFADPFMYDFHLLAGSSAIDQGDASVAPSIDHDGIIRPQGNGVDMGAYEYVLPSAIQPSSNHPLAIHPNPWKTQTKISIPNLGNQHVQIHLFDVTGRLVICPVTQTEDGMLIHRSNLVSGHYSFRLVINDEHQYSGKLIIID